MFVQYRTCFALQYKQQPINTGQKFQALVSLVLSTLHVDLFASLCAVLRFALNKTNKVIQEAKYIY